jgi:death-on-curing protein
MRYLTLAEALELHRRLIETSGGAHGVRDLGMLESALAQPRLTFDGEELYSDVIEKAGAVGFSLIQNHAFIDGNKRIGHAVMETFLVLNGYEITAEVDDQERMVLDVASGRCSRIELTAWLRCNAAPLRSEAR